MAHLVANQPSLFHDWQSLWRRPTGASHFYPPVWSCRQVSARRSLHEHRFWIKSCFLAQVPAPIRATSKGSSWLEQQLVCLQLRLWFLTSWISAAWIALATRLTGWPKVVMCSIWLRRSCPSIWNFSMKSWWHQEHGVGRSLRLATQNYSCWQPLFLWLSPCL